MSQTLERPARTVVHLGAGFEALSPYVIGYGVNFNKATFSLSIASSSNADALKETLSIASADMYRLSLSHFGPEGQPVSDEHYLLRAINHVRRNNLQGAVSEVFEFSILNYDAVTCVEEQPEEPEQDIAEEVNETLRQID